MDANEQLDLMIRSAEKQIELTHRSLEHHLNESDRIHARRASEQLVQAATAIVSDPTSEAP